MTRHQTCSRQHSDTRESFSMKRRRKLTSMSCPSLLHDTRRHDVAYDLASGIIAGVWRPDCTMFSCWRCFILDCWAFVVLGLNLTSTSSCWPSQRRIFPLCSLSFPSCLDLWRLAGCLSFLGNTLSQLEWRGNGDGRVFDAARP